MMRALASDSDAEIRECLALAEALARADRLHA